MRVLRDAFAVQIDVADADNVGRTYDETAQRYGASNNAAISSAEDASILDTELDASQRAQDVNFRASSGRVVGAASTAG